jgi:predicted protein tyrosine phosphatase
MTIIVCPLDEAAEACATHGPGHVISLLAPPAEAPEFVGPAARLRLRFNDIIVPTEGLIEPNANHIADLLDFLEGWDRSSPLLIHCWAGVSRSTAVGYLAATLRDGPGSEIALAARLRERAPFATPNSLIIALADQALGRQGAMTTAIAGIGRGAEAARGVLFRL